jgi:hypothetical protein
MKRTVLLVAAAASLAGFSGTATAAKPAVGATLSIAVSPTLVTFGTYTNVTGAISSKQTAVPLVLEANPYPFTGKWTQVGTASTTTDGAYSFTTLPTMTTHYRVATQDKPPVRSPEAGVQVRWKVGLGVSDLTPRKGARVRFHGSVRPAYPNGVVLIQRKTAAGWKTVKQTTMRTGTATASNYSVRLRIRHNGRYRAVVMGNGEHETGISRVRRLVVH